MQSFMKVGKLIHYCDAKLLCVHAHFQYVQSWQSLLKVKFFRGKINIHEESVLQVQYHSK